MTSLTQPRFHSLADPELFLGISRGALLLLALALPLHLPFALPTVEKSRVLGWRVAVTTGAESPKVRVMQTGWGAAMAGLQAGDVLVSIEGEGATLQTTERIRREAVAGDTLTLSVLRGEDLLHVRVPVETGSLSYMAYHWYRVLLALTAWLIGFSLLIWRGDRLANVVLGGALLLVGPVLLVVDLPDGGILSEVANYVWKLEAASYRISFPALLLCFLALRSKPPKPLRLPGFWAAVGVSLFLALATVTDGFTDPLAWAVSGWEREVRSVVGLVAELVALAGVLLMRREFRHWPTTVRWVGYGVLMVLLVGAPLSVVTLTMEEQTFVVELFRQLKTIVLGPFLAAVGLYLLMGRDDHAGEWEQRSHVAASASVLLTAVYGFAVAGTAAIMHSALDPVPHSAEWLLFVGIFVTALAFSPVLRWTRDLVDRRVFGRWVALETRAQTMVDHVAAELQPDRIRASIERELPLLLGLEEARLILSRDLVQSWHETHTATLEIESTATLKGLVAASALDDRERHVPVHRPDGTLLGAIRFRLPEGQRDLEPPEKTVLLRVTQGVAAALRNAESHLKLQRAQADLAEADHIAALGALAGGLAHEIKNPLSSLKMGLYLLGKESGGNDKLERIQYDVRRIDDLVSSLLRSTRTAAEAVPEPVDVREVTQRCVADICPIAEERGVTLIEDYSDRPIATLALESQIRIIVSNLLSNALDAVETGGTVKISLVEEPGGMKLEIRDSGPGIPREHIEDIFDLSFSTKPTGSGLGLVLARREVERLGGEIMAVPGNPSGSLLRVRIPGATFRMAPAEHPAL